MKVQGKIVGGLFLVALLGMDLLPASGQQHYGSRLGQAQDEGYSYALQGPGVMLDSIDPAMRKWYVPQELFQDYRWRQWEYTNYARDHYQRYVDSSLEGDYFYDIYGNFLTRGWLIFNNSQTTPGPNNGQEGNSLFKSNDFERWFSGLVVTHDQKGQYVFSMTLGNQLRSTLTPMVFSKPRFDGLQFDLATDRFEATMLYSRISSAGDLTTRNQESLSTNNTTLLGGRLTGQLGDYIKLGVHAVNAHQSNTLSAKASGNPLAGKLTVDQNQPISDITLVLRDDSPEDGAGGTAYFPAGSDVIITYQDGTRERGREIGFFPLVEGGFERSGFLAADGLEEIKLTYNFDSPDFLDNAGRTADTTFTKDSIVGVEFRLQVGNDYQIWVTSDRQTTVGRNEQTVLLLVAQAEGNVKDLTNLRAVRFEYGLPSATHVAGASLEIRAPFGFDFYGEYDRSWNYRKYPNVSEKTHRTAAGIEGAESAPAWMVNVSQKSDPWFLFGEAYSMDPRYSTRSFTTNSDGKIDYRAETFLWDFVEDNDDLDRKPDAKRRDWAAGDKVVFPGWDSNADFVPDFNQNDSASRSNTLPDYDESFLRFGVDRPEFLFGVDMNHNFWVDRYENDEAPDYPYRQDHEGFNIYGGVDVTPEVKLSAGMLREELISSNKKNYSNYAMLTVHMDTPRFGLLRSFWMTQWVEDDIPDPLLQWAPDNSLRLEDLDEPLKTIEDPMLARDTWINQLFIGHSINTGPWLVVNKINHVLYDQRMSGERLEELGLSGTDYFFGLVDKVSRRQRVGSFLLEPRWKSEYVKQTRGLFKSGKQSRLAETLALLVETEVLTRSKIQTGVEYVYQNNLDDDNVDLEENQQDFKALTLALQFTTVSDYLGYRLRSLVGASVEQRDFKERPSRTTNQFFVTIYAGLE
jgi:hypothetical protein